MEALSHLGGLGQIVLGGGSSAGAVALVLYLFRRLANGTEKQAVKHLEAIRCQMTRLVVVSEEVVTPALRNLHTEVGELRKDILRGGGQ